MINMERLPMITRALLKKKSLLKGTIMTIYSLKLR